MGCYLLGFVSGGLVVCFVCYGLLAGCWVWLLLTTRLFVVDFVVSFVAGVYVWVWLLVYGCVWFVDCVVVYAVNSVGHCNSLVFSLVGLLL